MLGTVTVNNDNQYQSLPDEVERRFLFIGVTSKSDLQNTVTAVSYATDLDKIFEGDTASFLYRDLVAAQLNGKSNWSASVVGLSAAEDWSAAIERAVMLAQYEAVAICDPVSDSTAINAVKDKLQELQSRCAQYLFAILRTAPINPQPSTKKADTGAQSWSEYIAAQTALVADITAERVMIVPTLFGPDVGVLAGRLCDRSVTVADSPMRTKTGTLLGIGDAPIDKDGLTLAPEHVQQLDAARFSVPQKYPGVSGWYWADGNTFDLKTGDYKRIENLRTVLKACRQVYQIAIPTIADRSLNSSPAGIAKHQQVFARPLRAMSKGVVINGAQFPGEIYPPSDNAIGITWVTSEKVIIYITIRPYASPKDITIGVGLDLSSEE